MPPAGRKAKAPYGKVCSRDPKAIRDIIRKKMVDFAREWAERGGGSAQEWWDFLSEKLKAEIQSLPVTCSH